MEVSNKSYEIQLNEDELKSAIELYMSVQHGVSVKIKYLKHKVGSVIESYGSSEIDIPYQDGVSMTVEDY